MTVVDKSGQVKTIEISPDRHAVVTDAAFSTNHQGAIEWAENAGFNKTAQRATFLENILYRGVSEEALTNAFLQPPLYNKQYYQGLGTLYTAVYHPIEGMMQLRWPNDSMVQSFDSFSEERKLIKFNQTEKPLF